MEEKKFCVYCHISPSGKMYVGITCKNPKIRWNYGYGYSKNPHFFKAIKKYGWDAFQHIILASGLSMQEASDMEIKLIKKYDLTDQSKGYNVNLGGMNECQFFSQAVKDKISASKRGKPCPDWQKKHLSEINKGKIPTNLDAIHKSNQKTVEQLDDQGRVIAIYPSIRTAGRECAINENTIGLCCRGKYRAAGGYKWRFAV